MKKRQWSVLLSLVLIATLFACGVTASPAEGDAEEEILTVEGDVQAPVKISSVAPSYTEEAKKEGVQGMVILRTTIDTAGNVVAVEVLQSQPYGLTEVASAAVEQWKFEPATLHGEPVKVYYNLTINFRLEKSKTAEED